MLTAARLDRGLFRNELIELRTRVLRNEHTSVASFAHDVVSVINSQFGNDASTLSELIALVSGRAEDMSPEDRDRRTLARRIVKAIEPLIDDATRKEAELNGRPYAQQIRELDEALLSRHDSLLESVGMPVYDSIEPKHETGIASPDDGDVEMVDSAQAGNEQVHIDVVKGAKELPEKADIFKQNGLQVEADGLAADTPPASTNGFRADHHIDGDVNTAQVQGIEPPTPPMSLQGHPQLPTSQAGIPWYAAPFDPEGTTIFEERWTGPEVLREMSEELSEMDEDELMCLGAGDDMVDAVETAPPGLGGEPTFTDPAATKKVSKKSGKRTRSSHWGTRSLRLRR